MLTLNRIQPVHLQALWNDELPRMVRKMHEAPRKLLSFDKNLGKLHMHAGLVGRAVQADPAAVAEQFRLAAACLSQGLSKRTQGGENDEYDVYEAELFLDVIAAFGSAAERQRGAQLAPWQLQHPEKPHHATQAALLPLLQRALLGQAPEPVQLRDVLKACEAPKASREDRLGVLPSARGLGAVARGDAEAFNLALAQLLAAHAESARSGDYKMMREGLVCLPALALARLGREAGLAVTVESDYLPLALLDVAPAA